MAKGNKLAWLNPTETTRSRSKKQESKIAKDLKGYTTINSGATLGQNDAITDYCEVEAKTTKAKSISFHLRDWNTLYHKTAVGKIPIFAIRFEQVDKTNKDFILLSHDDFLYLVGKANK